VSGVYTTEVRIQAPPEVVFPYLVDPELIVRWMGERAELDATPGGSLVLDVNGVPVRGRFLVVDPPHRVVFTWGVAGNDDLPPGSTTVDIRLRADGEATVVELAHRDLPEDQFEQHRIGWGHFLSRLAVAGPGGDAGPDGWAATAGSSSLST
jgi:uncharacterized protein YndB with AHSA1/START domain